MNPLVLRTRDREWLDFIKNSTISQQQLCTMAVIQESWNTNSPPEKRSF